jgi:hypothetical protein
MPHVPVPGRPQEYVRVIKTEEKGSDVNLATRCTTRTWEDSM